MPRQRRERSESKTYHVMIRGNAKQDIFLEQEDKDRFLEILGQKNQLGKYEMYAYCLMDNHIHLLINEGQDEISKIMQRINVAYAYYFNKKYDRIGHVFQDRFKSEVIMDDVQLLAVTRYIHNNPVKAHMSATPRYMWSSYSAYISGFQKNPNIDTDFVLKIFSEKEADAIQMFEEFSEQAAEESFIEYKEEIVQKILLSSESMVRDHIEVFCTKNKINLVDLKQKEMQAIRDELICHLKQESNVSIRRLAELLGINRNIVQRIK